jgi:hypothetical protein
MYSPEPLFGNLLEGSAAAVCSARSFARATVHCRRSHSGKQHHVTRRLGPPNVDAVRSRLPSLARTIIARNSE